MNSLPALFFSSFLIGFSGAAMPGPMLGVTMREAARRGFVAGPLVVLGHGILEFLLIVAIFFGLGKVLTEPLFFSLTGLVGGSILIWMAVGMFRSLPTLTLAAQTTGAEMHPTMGGILTSVSNPYFLLWWATVGLKLSSNAASQGVAGQATFFTGHILADLTWYSLVAALVHFGRALLTDRRYRVLVCALALMLLGFGANFAWDGFVKLREIL